MSETKLFLIAILIVIFFTALGIVTFFHPIPILNPTLYIIGNISTGGVLALGFAIKNQINPKKPKK